MKPKIAIISDVPNWAWAKKSAQLVRYLGDQFSLSVSHVMTAKPDPMPTGADLYHTFEMFQARLFTRGEPYVTGITAHVWDGHEKQRGVENVRRWCNRALAFHANSKMLESESAAKLGRPVWYVPNGVDADYYKRYRARRSSSRLVVGHVAKPSPRKGGDIVRRACELAGVELRVINNTHRNALPPEMMREFYQDLHVLAVASDMDGTPNPALEAAACGVAVVSNPIGNMPEFIIDGLNGIMVERSVDSLAAALRGISTDQAIRMGEAARATVEAGWTWRHMAPNYARMWLAALEAGKEKAA